MSLLWMCGVLFLLLWSARSVGFRIIRSTSRGGIVFGIYLMLLLKSLCFVFDLSLMFWRNLIILLFWV